jgi:hypothetical protein
LAGKRCRASGKRERVVRTLPDIRALSLRVVDVVAPRMFCIRSE